MRKKTDRGPGSRRLVSGFLSISLAFAGLLASLIPADALTFSNNALSTVRWEKYNASDPENTKIYSGGTSLVVYNRFVGSAMSAGDWNVNYCGPVNPNRLTVMGATGENGLGYPLDIGSETGQGGWLDGGASSPQNGLLLPAFDAYTASKRREYLCNASTWGKVKAFAGFDGVDPYTDVTVNNLLAAITAIGQEFADSLAPDDVGVNTDADRDLAYKATHACLINIMLYEVTMASDGNLYGYPLFTDNAAVNGYMSEIFRRVEVWNRTAGWGSMVSAAPGTHRATARFGYDTAWNKVPDMTATGISYTNSSWRVARYTAGTGSNDEQVYLARGFNTIRWKDPVHTGTLKLVKGSTDTGISGCSSLYSLAGAVYTVYSDAACTAPVGLLTTAASGESNVLTLNEGSYYVKETAAPPGFAADTDVHPAGVSRDTLTTVTVNDVPVSDPPAVLLRKVDADNEIRPSGNMSLGGARYAVRFYSGLFDTAAQAEAGGEPVRSWVFETDADGFVDLADSSRKISGDALWYAANGDVTLPLGTVVIYETLAPEGYLLSPEKYAVKITEDGADMGLVSTYNTPVIPETPVKGGVCVRKYDSELYPGSPETRGDATLAGAEFSIVNANPGTVTVNGREYGSGETCLVITTGADGRAASGNSVLPYGSYSVRETKAPVGYALNTGWSMNFSIRENGEMVNVGYVPETVIRGGIRVQKVSSETLRADSSLSGAVLGIALLSDKPVTVNSTLYGPLEGTLESKLAALADKSFLRSHALMTITTGDRGEAATGARELPYGTYYVAELDPPGDYLLNSSWYRIVEVRNEGEYVTLSGPDALQDEPVRFDISFVKEDGDTRRRLAGVVFRVTDTQTNEAHIIQTDSSGSFSSAAVPHTRNTNANDAAVSGDTVSEALLAAGAGVWFGGLPDDAKGAFPAGTYRFEELRCSANAGYTLLSFERRLTSSGSSLQLGVLGNYRPVITSTSLVEQKSASHNAGTEQNTVLVDSVNYSRAAAGKEYTLAGALMDKESGRPVCAGDVPVTASVRFTAEAESGTAEVIFTLNSLLLDGRSVVAFETLKEGDIILSEHKDINDGDQTVSFADENPGRELPETGGKGTSGIFRLGALLLLLGAVIAGFRCGNRKKDFWRTSLKSKPE